MNQGRDPMAAASDSAQQQLGFIEQLQRQQEMQQQQLMQNQNQMNQTETFMSRDGEQSSTRSGSNKSASLQRINEPKSPVGCEKTTVLELLPILHPNDHLGLRFRASYTLSFGSMFQLPSILTADEYRRQFTGQMPKYDVAALQAAMFAESAVGAMVDGQRSMMYTLMNASILCLQDSVKEPVHARCRLELARAFFLHSLLRCYNGDMERCLKYRRAAMNTLGKLDVGANDL
jgi:hypothetical protein